MTKGNLFGAIPDSMSEELFETLAEGEGSFFIERIVSDGHHSPPDFWYNQETTEWVVLLRGSAEVRLRQPDMSFVLGPGDWVEIPAGTPHRVESTSGSEKTVWLAVHWR